MFDKEILQYKIGGLLYMPAFQKNIVQKISGKKLPHLTSAAFCLEDSIRDESLTAAETSLKFILQELEGVENLPLIFVRIRSPRHLEIFHDKIGSRMNEVKCHLNWARRVKILSEIYGVDNENLHG